MGSGQAGGSDYSLRWMAWVMLAVLLVQDMLRMY